jgi:hypothetical protein
VNAKRTIIRIEENCPVKITGIKTAFSTQPPEIGDDVSVQNAWLKTIGMGKVIAVHPEEKTYDIEVIWNEPKD